jgi:hypothetical protein
MDDFHHCEFDSRTQKEMSIIYVLFGNMKQRACLYTVIKNPMGVVEPQKSLRGIKA